MVKWLIRLKLYLENHLKFFSEAESLEPLSKIVLIAETNYLFSFRKDRITRLYGYEISWEKKIAWLEVCNKLYLIFSWVWTWISWVELWTEHHALSQERLKGLGFHVRFSGVMDSASDFESEGCGFESHLDRIFYWAYSPRNSIFTQFKW